MTGEERREVIEHLLKIWDKHPYLRLAQLVAGGHKTELYYFEDQPFVSKLEQTYPLLPPPPPPPPPRPKRIYKPVFSEAGKDSLRASLNRIRHHRWYFTCDFCGELELKSKKSTIRYKNEGDFALCPKCFSEWEAKPDGAELVTRARVRRRRYERAG